MAEKLVLPLSEAAELLGITSKQLYSLTRSRSQSRQLIPIPHMRLGRRLAFRKESLEQWISELEKLNSGKPSGPQH